MMKLKTITRTKPLKLSENRNTLWKFKQEKHEIDIIQIYQEIEKKFNDSTSLKKGIVKVEYLNRLKEEVQFYCENNKIDFEYHFEPICGKIIIDNNSQLYVRALAYQLSWLDKDLIRLFLNRYNDNYPKKRDFVNLVESQVYKVFVKICPFRDFAERQKLITDWLEFYAKRTKPKTDTNLITFEKLFIVPNYDTMLLKILKDKSILDTDGSWIGLSYTQTDVTSLITVLKKNGYIRDNLSQEIVGRVFCKKFNITLSESSMRHQSKKSKSYDDDYELIFPLIVKKSPKSIS